MVYNSAGTGLNECDGAEMSYVRCLPELHGEDLHV